MRDPETRRTWFAKRTRFAIVPLEPPIDVKQDYPDLVSDSVSVGPPPMLFHEEETAET